MKRIVRVAMLAMGAVWVGALIGALRAKQTIEPVDEPEANEVVLTGIFGQLAFRSTARAFRGGRIECWYGGGMVDLRGATLDPAGAHLQVRAVLGGGQIVVPPTWQVTVHGRGIGGVTDGRDAADRPDTGPELVIDGTVVLGGFVVVSDLDEGADRWLTETVVAERTARSASTEELITDN